MPIFPLALLAAAFAGPAPGAPAAAPSKVVFIAADDEYRSEESMPMLAALLKRDHGIEPTVMFPLNDAGEVTPDRLDHLPGLEALAGADLLVLFARWRDLPPDQMRHFVDYVESGRPVVGFRTGTHPFKFAEDSPLADWNERKIAELVGQRWIVHHGHFADGEAPLTRVRRVPGVTASVLRGVGTPFTAYSWLYHVTGGGEALAAGSTPLLVGTTLRSDKLRDGKGAQYPPIQPVAWTKTNPFGPADAEPGRVFFSTLGHPYDFKRPEVRRLAVQGVLWALGREGEIPKGGVPADTVRPYEPSNSGFGTHRNGRTPAEILAEAGLEPAAD